jgi:AGCS family alanine or glycine:cation symporter
MDQFAQFIDAAASRMYWPWTVCLALATAAFFSFRTGFVQLRRFREAVRTMVATQQAGAGGAISPFQAFMTGRAATIGTGNIIGVATAIISGGPGALFWIWVYGFLATSVKFSEAVLGLKFRIARGEQTLSGPMYYLRDGLGSPALAWLYALIAAIAVLFTTPFTQPNSIAGVLDAQFERQQLTLGEWSARHDEATKATNDDEAAAVELEDDAAPIPEPFRVDLNRLVIGLVLAVLTWLVIIGGVKSIGRAAEKLSPLKVALYMIGGLIVIGSNITRVPEVLSLVFREAFSLRAGLGTAEGAAVWVALRFGLARGMYANEAGYGTAAVVYGVAKSDRPEQQGLNAMMEVFIITFITSTISALTILLTDMWKMPKVEAPVAVSSAFESAMPTVGGWMLAVSVFLFGYTTLLGWSFYGEQYLEYLFGRRIIMPYRWLYCCLIPLGAIAKVDLVWAWGDILNGAQIFPNLIGLFALSGLAASFAKRHDESSTTSRPAN